MRKMAFVLVLMLALVSTGAFAQSDSVTLRITWYDDGNEGAVLRELLDQFEANNPDITVELDTVAYNVILEQIPQQVQAGESPDLLRLTNYLGLRGYYLDLTPYLSEPETFEGYFPAGVLDAFRTDAEDEGLYGLPLQTTVSGLYANATLFEQAGVEMPTVEDGWDVWIEAATAAAEATETPYAIAFDRAGHRFAGPAISEGAAFVNEDGSMTIDQPGFRVMAERLKAWHDSGITPVEVWLGAGGSYAAAADYFINGQAVLYMAGSWQINNFATNIGDNFDWVAVGNPAGEEAASGMPGGAALLAMAATEHPEEVGRLMDFLATPEIYAQFTAETLFLPGHLALPEFEYETDNDDARAALEVFAAEVPKLADAAYALNFHPKFFDAFNIPARERLTQYLAGELTLDEAIERIQQDADTAINPEA